MGLEAQREPSQQVPVVLLVTGRTAVARIGGMPSVARHVATIRRLGMEPVVLYPARMKALGAEIRGELGDETRCVPSDTFGNEPEAAEPLVLVLAGDWYIAPRDIVTFATTTQGVAAARFSDRGRVVAPMARLSTGALQTLIPKLADNPSADLIREAAGDEASIYDLPPSSRHRLSDNVACGRAEAKLFSSLGRSSQGWHVRLVQKHLSLPLTRRLARTSVTPTQVSAAKFALGLLAAMLLAGEGYFAGLLGALVFLGARVMDGVAEELAQAAIRDRSASEKADFAGDVVVLIAVSIAVASRPELANAGRVLGVVTVAGILVSALVTYQRVLRERWSARTDTGFLRRRSDDFAFRFAHRDGVAWGLLLAAAIARLDLFLWSAAIASHVYYIRVIVGRPKGKS